MTPSHQINDDYRFKLLKFTNKHFMKFLIVAGLFIFMIECKNGEKGKAINPPKEGFSRILGVYIKRDGTKQVEVLGRQIYKSIKFDSITKKDVVVIDTVFGTPVIIKAFDSKGTILKTKEGKDSINPNPVYIPIGKDSVNTHVENTPIDSLLKK